MSRKINADMKVFFMLMCITAFSTTCYCQLQKNDTTLWLRFDPHLDYKGIILGKYANDPPNPDTVVHYVILSAPHLYDGYPLEFTSIKKTPSDTITVESLKDRNVVTTDQLSNFIINNYPKGAAGFRGAPYFRKLKHIFILEAMSQKGFMLMTTVRVNVHEGD